VEKDPLTIQVHDVQSLLVTGLGIVYDRQDSISPDSALSFEVVVTGYGVQEDLKIQVCLVEPGVVVEGLRVVFKNNSQLILAKHVGFAGDGRARADRYPNGREYQESQE
jgi:hypothetical protein